MPPPAEPSTVLLASSSCILAMRACMSCACFNRLPIAPIPAMLVFLAFDPLYSVLTIFSTRVTHRAAKNTQRFFNHRTALIAGARARRAYWSAPGFGRGELNHLHGGFLREKAFG